MPTPGPFVPQGKLKPRPPKALVEQEGMLEPIVREDELKLRASKAIGELR